MSQIWASGALMSCSETFCPEDGLIFPPRNISGEVQEAEVLTTHVFVTTKTVPAEFADEHAA
jgi:hypothetical protein